MKRIGIIFPDDLAANNKTLQHLNDEDTLLIYEPCDTFYQIRHHKQKIAFLISALRHWKEELQKKYSNIIHIKISKDHQTDFMSELDKIYEANRFDVIHITQPSDHNTLTQLMFFVSKKNVTLRIHHDTKFIDSIEDFSEWAKDRKSLCKNITIGGLEKNMIC